MESFECSDALTRGPPSTRYGPVPMRAVQSSHLHMLRVRHACVQTIVMQGVAFDRPTDFTETGAHLLDLVTACKDMLPLTIKRCVFAFFSSRRSSRKAGKT